MEIETSAWKLETLHGNWNIYMGLRKSAPQRPRLETLNNGALPMLVPKIKVPDEGVQIVVLKVVIQVGA